jgi:hypothetical protein
MFELLKSIYFFFELVQQIGIVGIFIYHEYKNVEILNTKLVYNA